VPGQRVGLELLEFAGRLRETGLVQGHLLDEHLALVDVLDGREPLEHDALFERLFDLEVVRGHLVAGAAVDDDRLFGAEPLGGAGRVDGGVAAAVDDDLAAEHRLVFLGLDVVQVGDRVEDLGRLAPAGM
jgi:hypothetical protein